MTVSISSRFKDCDTAKQALSRLSQRNIAYSVSVLSQTSRQQSSFLTDTTSSMESVLSNYIVTTPLGMPMPYFVENNSLSHSRTSALLKIKVRSEYLDHAKQILQDAGGKDIQVI